MLENLNLKFVFYLKVIWFSRSSKLSNSFFFNGGGQESFSFS